MTAVHTAVLNRNEALALYRMIERIRRNPARYGVLSDDAEIIAPKLYPVLSLMGQPLSLIVTVS